MYFTSRTAALTYQTCKRKRFLSNHYGNHGLSPEAIDMNLEVGTAIHKGLQWLFEHCRLHHPTGDFDSQCVEEAVQAAINKFRADIVNSSVAVRAGEMPFLPWIIAEHESVVEGLIRCFAIKRLPLLLSEYEIIEVEMEEEFIEFSNIVTWQSKADAKFLTKDYSKGVIVCSIKSAAEYADVTLRNILTDMQGNSEWAAADAKLKRDFDLFISEFNLYGDEYMSGYRWKDYFLWCLEHDEVPKVYAVQYEHLITGTWRDFEKMGLRKRQSFLVHPYKLEMMGGINAFTGAKTVHPDAYKWKWGAGKQPTLWNKVDIWEDIGVKNWVEMLATGQVQPEEGNPLDSLIITSELVFRDPARLHEWLISTRFQEETIVEHLEELKAVAEKCDYLGDWSHYETKLMQLFPKETQTCWNYYGHDCQFAQVCHGGMDLNELIASEVYVTRTPHHEEEKKYFTKRGYIKE